MDTAPGAEPRLWLAARRRPAPVRVALCELRCGRLPPEPLAGERCEEGAADEKLLPTLKDLQRQFGERTSGRFVRLYLRGTSVFGLIDRDQGAFRNALRDWARTAEVAASRYITALDENVDRIAELLDLQATERGVLAFQIGRARPGFSQLFELLMGEDHATKAVLGAALGHSESEVVSALSEQGALVRSGLLNVKERPLVVRGPSSHLIATLAEPAEEDAALVERFVKPMSCTPSTGSLGRLHEDVCHELSNCRMQVDSPTSRMHYPIACHRRGSRYTGTVYCQGTADAGIWTRFSALI